MSKESSISVAVRIRPFTEAESTQLINQPDSTNDNSNPPSLRYSGSSNRLLRRQGIRNILNAVDDRMLIFDPPETNPLVEMEQNAFPNGFNKQQLHLQQGVGNHSSRIREHRFVFDRLLDMQASQEEVYNSTTKPMLDSILEGFNSTVFAYGATGCGKTHTITGTSEHPGVIFLTMSDLFLKIDELKDKFKIEVSLSYLEIYNETIRDLLNPSANPRSLNLREDSSKRIIVTNLSTHVPTSVEDVMDMIVIGNKNRTVSSTAANAVSSRSHAVLQINVVKKPKTMDLQEQHTFATLSIIDLAGSERASATKNKGIRLSEGANINKSLLALGNCINALCDGTRKQHVPYRDSKLTRLLKFSLGGNCKTVMIVCVSPSSKHYDETLNTLKYADRAKEIKTKLIRNQQNLSRHVGSYLKMITEQKREIEELKAREGQLVKVEVDNFIKNRTKCQRDLINSIEDLRKSLDKNRQIQVSKAYLLARRKMLLMHRSQFESFLTSLDSTMTLNFDLEKLEPIVPFSTLLELIDSYLNKLAIEINDLERQFEETSELDFILEDTSQFMLKRLIELESWSEQDTLIYETLLLHLKDSLEKTILMESSIMLDDFIKQSGLSFLNEALSGCFNLITKLMTSNYGLDFLEMKLKVVVGNCVNRLEELLNDGIGFIQNYNQYNRIMSNEPSRDDLRQQFQIPQQQQPPTPPDEENQFQQRPATLSVLETTPKLEKVNGIKRGKRLSSSPLAKPSYKVNKLTPVHRNIKDNIFNKPSSIPKIKKMVRWEDDIPFSSSPSPTTINLSSKDDYDFDITMQDDILMSGSRKQLNSPLRRLVISSDEFNKSNDSLNLTPTSKNGIPSALSAITDNNQLTNENKKGINEKENEIAGAEDGALYAAESFKKSEFKFDPKQYNINSPTAPKPFRSTNRRPSNIPVPSPANKLTSRSLSPIKGVGLSSPGSKFQFKTHNKNGLNFMYHNNKFQASDGEVTEQKRGRELLKIEAVDGDAGVNSGMDLDLDLNLDLNDELLIDE